MPALAQQQEEEQTSFYLQGFDEEKKLCTHLSKDMSVQQMKEQFLEHSNLQTLLNCPLGVTYFHKFLSAEMNVENLQCYLDLKALLDYIKFARKCPLFDLQKVNELEEQIEQKIDREYAQEHALEMQLEAIEDARNVEEVQEEPQQQQLSQQSQIIGRSSQLSGSRMEQYGQDIMKKSNNFIQKYISENAIAEVNIDSKTRREVKQAFETITNVKAALNEAKKKLPNQDAETMRNSEEVMKNVSQMQEAVQAVENKLDALRTALLANLADPMARFKHSQEVDECLSLFLTVEDRNFHRDRLLNADKGGVVLNMDRKWNSDVITRSPLTIIAEILHEARILFSNEDFWVWNDEHSFLQLDYDRLADVKYWAKVRDMAGELSVVDLSSLVTDEERLTFWINLYNFMMLHAVVTAEGIPVVELSRQLFYRKTKYNVAGMEFSLEDIREGIIFGNKGSNCVFGKQFKKNDVRKNFAVQKPIINSMFAMSCFSLQSPKIQVLEVDNIYEQLAQATVDMLDNYMTIDEEKNVVAPQIMLQRKIYFKLFADDADASSKSQTDALINFLKRYATHFQKEEHKNDKIVFKPINTLVTNLSVILTEKDKAVIEKKKKASPSTTKKSEPKKQQSTGEVTEAVKAKKCSWSAKSLQNSFKRFSLRRKQKKAVAVQDVNGHNKCTVM